MKPVLRWKNNMQFEAESDGHAVLMDAKSPIGHGKAMTPKELVAVGLGGCTAMDVVALFKKHKQEVKSFEVSVDITPSKGKHPMVFEKAVIEFNAEGSIDSKLYLEAVELSQTKYCGVSAMMLKAFPIEYKVILNNEMIGEGHAKFES